EIRRVIGGLNEVAFRIDMEQLHVLTKNLASDNKVAAEIHGGLLLATVTIDDFAHRGADQLSHLEHGAAVEQVGTLLPQTHTQQTQHTLGGGQVAGTEQHNQPFS